MSQLHDDGGDRPVVQPLPDVVRQRQHQHCLHSQTAKHTQSAISQHYEPTNK